MEVATPPHRGVRDSSYVFIYRCIYLTYSELFPIHKFSFINPTFFSQKLYIFCFLHYSDDERDSMWDTFEEEMESPHPVTGGEDATDAR